MVALASMTRRIWLPAAIVQVIDRVEERIEQRWTLERMAEEACFSPFHFHRVFRDAVGETPAAFLERLRLERAALLLLAGEQPITGLSMDVGFRNPETFARRFRAHFEVSARDYRRHQLELWSELGLKAGEDPLPGPGEIVVTELPRTTVEVRRSLGEDEGFSFDAAAPPWSDWGSSRAPCIGATLDWPGIAPAGRIRQDWGRFLNGRGPADGHVRRWIGGGPHASLPVAGPGPAPTTAYQRLFVWAMAGRHRLRPGPILEIQTDDGLVVHQPVTDTRRG